MDLSEHITPQTVQDIFAWYEQNRGGGHRPHLGGSQIGNGCSRALWYQFHWYQSPEFEGRILRLFETGDREEERLVRNLRDVGVKVWDRDPESGRQFNYKAHGGHFGLSLDGVGKGFKESPRPHALEFKTMSTKYFNEITKKGLEQAKPVYWAQVQVGMYLSGLDRAFFFAVCKDTDAIYAERVRLKTKEAKALIEKAGKVIFAPSPPAKISDDASWWECRFCDYRGVCHEQKLPEINCRTCAHSTAEKSGTWSCARRDNDLDLEQQQTGCEKHLYNPTAMPWAAVEGDETHVVYENDWIDNAGIEK